MGLGGIFCGHFAPIKPSSWYGVRANRQVTGAPMGDYTVEYSSFYVLGTNKPVPVTPEEVPTRLWRGCSRIFLFRLCIY